MSGSSDWACDPIGLSKPEAAAYIGVGVTLFDQMVIDGRMPKPKRINGRTIWDREDVRLAFKALPSEHAERESPRSALDRMTA